MSEVSPSGALSLSMERRVHAACEKFEAAWNAGTRPRIQDCLTSVPELARPVLLTELLALDLAYRARAGERPAPEEYEGMFPDDVALVRAAFAAAGAGPEPRPPGGDSSQARATTRESATGAEAVPPCFGRYETRERLGSGTFGIVYRAYDPVLKREVAVKALRRAPSSPSGVDAYVAEGQALAGLDHPGIVPVYDVGCTEDGCCYLVSKLVSGTDLRERAARGPLRASEAAAVVAGVADALHHAHRRGLVHRDIKPANILLDADGRPVVADFGLALREEDFGIGPTSVIGTPAYMSPEQVRGEGHRVDARSDVYSLGVVLYELLTGRVPFDATDLQVLFEQITTCEPRPPRQWDDSIPKDLDRVCLKCLAKRAPDRFSTARDLAEELGYDSPDTAGAPPAIMAVPASMRAANLPLSPPAAPPGPPPRVIPKGLRSFDAADADFFLELLPGPRDRDGLPDTLRFWKHRVEATDPDQAFGVGILYGPSGCGKSSLVKAGLLPVLAGHVLAVYVEATATGTEARLLNALRRHCPRLCDSPSLLDALTHLRRGYSLPDGKKILLVIDQLEQWLHDHQDPQHAELVQALRQCDGEYVQCLVLVRDDFWMATTRFMRDLEVPLREGHNSSAVDLFDPGHARRVLAAFGRAFGALPEAGAAPEQQRFLDQAVAGLAREGKVIPVRLSLFAEMVKGKPWGPATLKVVGVEGIGVLFLEDTFGATAPPEHRRHKRAARSILQALLPEPGTDLKGHMRPRQHLLGVSGYVGQPEEFERVLTILDSELRLVTPSDPEGPTAEADAVSPGKRYQLTHDYLVPALRQWLTRDQRKTQRGRAELRLAERAAAWNVQREERHLPALWEWASIVVFTLKQDRTVPQQEMMRAATRRNLHCGAITAVLLTALALGGGYLRARVIVSNILVAEVPQVPDIAARLGAATRLFANPRLKEVLARPESAGTEEHLKASLALLPVDPGQAPYLHARLLKADPEQLRTIRQALQDHQQQDTNRLWTVVREGEESGQRLRAACALAAFDTDGPQWTEFSPTIAGLLVAESPVQVDSWRQGFAPASGHLIPHLETIFRDRDRPWSRRLMAAKVLAFYTANRPDKLAELVKDADGEQFKELLPSLIEAPREPILDAMEAELKKKDLDEGNPNLWDDHSDPRWIDVDQSLVRTIKESGGGQVWPRFALCQTLPLSDFERVAPALEPSGYRPICFRPYAAPAGVLVAAVWVRDRRKWQMEQGLTAEEVVKKDEYWQRQGLVPLDVTGYPTRPGGGAESERYAVLWVARDPGVVNARIFVGEPEAKSLSGQYYVPRTLAHIERGGRQLHSSVWWKPARPADFSAYSRQSEEELWYEHQLGLKNLQGDVRCPRPRCPPPRARITPGSGRRPTRPCETTRKTASPFWNGASPTSTWATTARRWPTWTPSLWNSPGRERSISSVPWSKPGWVIRFFRL